MTELKLTINQCPIEGDDEKFLVKCEIKGSTFEATDIELVMRACMGKALRKAVQIWCDEMIKKGLASYCMETDIDEDDEPEDPFNEQPNRRR